MLTIKTNNGRYYIFRDNKQAYPFGFDSYVRAMLMMERL